MYFTFVPRIGLDITDVHNIDGLVFHCKHYTTKLVDTAVYRLMNTATRADASEYRDQLVKDVNEALEYLAASWRECALTMGDEIHSLRAQVAALKTRAAEAEEEARIAKERTICRDDETSNNVAIDHQWISPCPPVAPVQVPTMLGRLRRKYQHSELRRDLLLKQSRLADSECLRVPRRRRRRLRQLQSLTQVLMFVQHDV
ncbi:hypothetical protein Poli38472_000404 [Pythium oligandrum]|uniref:Uncharacterized protein n=1 Tax=Pythium oligandrum TaxID=41045 RepID=A0A8K1FI28_PYTOL|nr:hypothetical protein Poli38472_000404 [Pythium oligandrum]|eukprot:TMW60362.1 hypothetical protein Poli38472_000404 [Pythium oligandrum]